MDLVVQEMKNALRALRARPGLSLSVVLTLGLAIGANTAIFSVIEAVLLRQLPYHDAERVVGVWSDRKDGSRDPFSIPDYRDLSTAARTVTLSAYAAGAVNLTGGDEPERVPWARTTAGFWKVLGVMPVLGRPFTAAEEEAGAHVVLLDDGLWRRRFGASPDAVGRSIVVDEETYQVVGVLPRGFRFPGERAPELAAPFAPERDRRASHRELEFLRVIARLAPGATIAGAAAELTALARVLDERFAADSHRRGILVRPVADELVGPHRALLLLLLAAVGLVLLIGCANLANLMLASGVARRREHAIRAALGAGRARLVRQALAECLLLSLAGGALGVLLALYATSLLISLSPRQIPRLDESGLDPAVLVFAAFISVASGVLCAVLPGLQASRSDPAENLGDGRSSPAPRSLRTQRLLVAAELGLSLTLLAVAGLLVRSFVRLSGAQPGFQAEGVLTMRLSLPERRYGDGAAAGRFVEALRGRLRALPGVVEAGSVNALPLSGTLATSDFIVDGIPPPSKDEVPEAYYRMVGPGYFAALGIPLIEGRDLAEPDRAGGTSVAVVNQHLARKFFPNRSAVGGRLRIEGESPWKLVEIVGVVGDVAQDVLGAAPTVDIYVPLSQVPANYGRYALNFFVAVRTRGDPLTSARAVVAAIRAQDGLVPVADLQPMAEVLAASTAPRRFNLVLVEVFAAAALLLAALGVYSLTAFSIRQRRRELSIRLALGARPPALVRLSIRDAMRPTLVGLALGLAGALLAGQLTAGLLVGVSPSDPATLVIASATLCATAILAAWLPARSAARVDPQLALRAE